MYQSEEQNLVIHLIGYWLAVEARWRARKINSRRWIESASAGEMLPLGELRQGSHGTAGSLDH